MFVDLIHETSVLWPSYKKGKKTDKNNRVHQIIVNELPETIFNWVNQDQKYMSSGSDGQGNLLQAPWFALFNKDITTSAQKGYYIVYLFSEDLSSLTLEIGFGATQFKDKFGIGKEFFSQLELAVQNMRINSKHLLDKNLKKSLEKTNMVEVKLDLSGNFNLKAYEKCAIYSITYSINNLPNDNVLKSDFLEYVQLYDAMVDSLLLAEVEDYVLENIEVPEISLNTEIKDFEPRIRKAKNTTGGKNSNSKNYRRSKKSDKIGKLGEEWVFNYEQKKLKECGKKDLSDSIIWHREFAENRTPGWDITSYDIFGNKILIEVKSSEGTTINEFELTAQELEKAKSEIADSYYIYLVTNILTNPKLEIIKNPYKYISEGTISIKASSYSINLFQND